MRSISPCLLALTLLVGCEYPGQRFLHVSVELDGRPLLETGFGQSDAATVTEAWRKLADRELDRIDEIAVDEEDPTRATLRGKVSIRMRHADSVFASAELDSLQLRRDSAESTTWRIPRDELQRAAAF